MFFKLSFLIIICFSIPLVVSSNVVINEISWMGTTTSSNDEWIELYNTSDNDINLDKWILKAEDKSPKIELSGKIPAKGFYLLERTDDTTVAGITADLIYTGALNNTGENLSLYDNSGNLTDKAYFSDEWPAGNNETKQTMEKKESENWQTSQNPEGTPKAKNSSGSQEKSAQVKPLPDVEVKSQQSSEVYPGGVIFKEILPSPEGPDAENEWIEIFNQNNFEVDLSGWKIKDIEGRVTTYTFLAGTKLSSKEYLVLFRPTTKITLNNDKDGLNLIQPNNEIIDSVKYEKAKKGQSYNKAESNWFWSSDLTPGKENSIKKQETENKKDNKLTETGFQPIELAGAGVKLTESSNQQTKAKKLSPFLIAFIISIFSGIVIIILKKELSEKSSF